jgi:uncharacterized protein
MRSFQCTKCGHTEYMSKEMRAEGGLLSAMFDISTNRFIGVSCTNCGFTEFYRKGVGAGSKILDYLVG